MVPLYRKIYEELKKQIASGQLAPGDQVPTEMELSESYQVSRITSKRALTELEQAGLIQRTRGKGSFVKEQTVRRQHSRRILFILPFYNDLSLGNFSAGLNPAVQEAHYEVMMTSLDFLANHSALEIINEFDGLIYYANDEDQYLELLLELMLKKFPTIILDKELHDFSFPAILSDNLAGGFLATQHLLSLGHQKIGYLFGDIRHQQSTRQRYLGYIQALKEAQIDFHTGLEDETARTATLIDYLKEHQLTALVCENDVVAIEAIRILNSHGPRVPAEISVVGFDDIQAAALIDPPLTTISQNFTKIGKLAGQALIHWIESGQQPPTKKVPVDLIVRNSTRTPKNS